MSLVISWLSYNVIAFVMTLKLMEVVYSHPSHVLFLISSSLLETV